MKLVSPPLHPPRGLRRGSEVSGSRFRTTCRHHPRGLPRLAGRWDAELWSDDVGFDEFEPFPAPEGSEALGVVDTSVVVTAMSADTAGIRVGFHVSRTYQRSMDELPVSAATYLRTYDLDGQPIDTQNLGSWTDFDDHDDAGVVTWVNSVRGMPDGSVVWSGRVRVGAHPNDPAWRFDQGALGVQPPSGAGSDPWTIMLAGTLDSPHLHAPAEDVAADAQPTADGGILVRGRFLGHVAVGDNAAFSPDFGTFVARLNAQGTSTWIRSVGDSTPIGVSLDDPNLGTGSDGTIYTVSYLDETGRQALIQVDGDGEQVGTTDLDAPYTTAMTVGHDRVILAGSVQVDSGFPAFVQIHDLDGQMIDMAIIGADPPSGGSMDVRSVAISADGHTAVSGTFWGALGIGGEPVATENGALRGFVAVFNPSRPAVD